MVEKEKDGKGEGLAGNWRLFRGLGAGFRRELAIVDEGRILPGISTRLRKNARFRR